MTPTLDFGILPFWLFICFSLKEGHNDIKKFFTTFYSLSLILILNPAYKTPYLNYNLTHPFLFASYKYLCLLFFEVDLSDSIVKNTSEFTVNENYFIVKLGAC